MNIFDTVGNTPLFKLQHVYRSERGIDVYGKGELLNPSGPVKDRAAKAMLLDGWNSDRLMPGMPFMASGCRCRMCPAASRLRGIKCWTS